MAVNLTPQYLEAEADYKRAQTAEEKLACLRRMWTLVPKHKASEKLQADLKTKISDMKEEVEKERKAPKKGGGPSFRFPKQGAGQFVLVGGPNGGKSSFVRKFTRATPEVAPYPFTTREPSAGMMDWEDIRYQLIDTPPITADAFEAYVGELVRGADAALLIVDLADDDCPFTTEATLSQLASVKKVLVGIPPAEGEANVFYQKTLMLANKVDADGAAERLDIIREMFESQFPIVPISLERGDGLDDLPLRLYQLLGVMRIFTKEPGKPADMTAPFTIPIGSNIVDLATKVHQELGEKVKSARVWGTAVTPGQSVGRDHTLQEKDVVELHT